MGSDTVLFEFRKNGLERVRVMLRQYKGADLVDLRVWYNDEVGVAHPTRKGISIRPELIPQLMRGLDLALAAQDRT